MPAVITSKAASFSTIKANVLTYLNSKEEYKTFLDTSDSTTINMFVDMIAGYGTWRNYKSAADRNETFLYSAMLDNSKYSKGREYGYNINRATAPVITLTYDGTPTLTVKPWDKLGSVLNGTYDLVYTGKTNTILEKGDTIAVSIGLVGSFSDTAMISDGLLAVDVAADNLKYMDNDAITLSINGVMHTLTKMLEEYVIYSKATDFSYSPSATTIEICDIDNNYGIKTVKDGDELVVTWLETNGYEKFSLTDYLLNDNFIFNAATYNGTNGDTAEKVRQLAPLFFSTLRRAVTPLDHKYVIEASSYISSCFVEADPGVPWIVEAVFEPVVTGKVFVLILNNNTVSYTANASDTRETVIDYFFKVLSYNTYTYVEKSDHSLKLTEKNAKFHITLEGTSISYSTIQEWVKPKCCTANIYYAHTNLKHGQDTLTEYEKLMLKDYIEKFKVVGVFPDWIPATPITKDLKATISLTDLSYKEQVLASISDILNEMQFVMGGSFSYPEFITAVSQISVFTEEDSEYLPVVSVTPNQDMFSITVGDKEYLKFNTEIVVE